MVSMLVPRGVARPSGGMSTGEGGLLPSGKGALEKGGILLPGKGAAARADAREAGDPGCSREPPFESRGAHPSSSRQACRERPLRDGERALCSRPAETGGAFYPGAKPHTPLLGRDKALAPARRCWAREPLFMGWSRAQPARDRGLFAQGTPRRMAGPVAAGPTCSLLVLGFSAQNFSLAIFKQMACPEAPMTA